MVSGKGHGDKGEDRESSAKTPCILFCEMGETEIFF